jgi:hypothetical protein
MAKVRFQTGNKWRFGPDWPGQRCGAKTSKGTPCQRPSKLPVGRCRHHGGADIYWPADRGWSGAAYSGPDNAWEVYKRETGDC